MYAFKSPSDAATLLSIDGRFRLVYAGRNAQGEETYVPHLNMVPCMRRLNAAGFDLTTFYGKAHAQSFNCHILNDGIPPRFRKLPEVSMRNIFPAEMKRLGYSCEVTSYDAVGYSFKIGVDFPTFEKLFQPA